jgi:hypothetical protein
MHRTYRYGLMKQNPLVPDYAESSMPFHGGNGNGECSVAGRIHNILTIAFVCLDTWLKPLLSQAERQNLCPVQEYDPYVAGLLRYLRAREGIDINGYE